MVLKTSEESEVQVGIVEVIDDDSLPDVSATPAEEFQFQFQFK